MQNIKKEVNIYDRFLCVLLALSVASLFVLCSFRPIDVFADDVVPYSDIASLIRQFERESKQGMDDLQQAIQTDIENGNLDATSAYGQQVMKAYVMQLVAVSSPELMTLYNAANYAEGEAQEWIDWYNSHQTITVSGSSSSGFYKDNTGDIKIISISPVASGLIISGDGFSFNMDFIDADSNNNNHSNDISCASSVSGNVVTFRYTTTNSIGRNIPNPTPYGSLNGSPVTVPSKSYWISSEMWLNKFSPLSLRYQVNSSSIPVFSGSSYDFTYFLSWSSNSVMGYSQSYDLVSTTIDSSDPWNIYNTVLPQIKQQCPDVTNNYYIFNNGYTPAVPPTEPTEPPLFPFTQPWQNDFVYPQTETSVSIINPTATNDSGTTYTETTIVEVPVTETSSSYVPVYGFNVPLLPNLETVTATLPADTVPPETAQKITDLWAFVKWILDESGMFPIFLALVSIGFVMFIIRFIGG